jgi:hypothetical protein
MLLKYASTIEESETAALAGLSQLAGEHRGDRVIVAVTYRSHPRWNHGHLICFRKPELITSCGSGNQR